MAVRGDACVDGLALAEAGDVDASSSLAHGPGPSHQHPLCLSQPCQATPPRLRRRSPRQATHSSTAAAVRRPADRDAPATASSIPRVDRRRWRRPRLHSRLGRASICTSTRRSRRRRLRVPTAAGRPRRKRPSQSFLPVACCRASPAACTSCLSPVLPIIGRHPPSPAPGLPDRLTTPLPDPGTAYPSQRTTSSRTRTASGSPASIASRSRPTTRATLGCASLNCRRRSRSSSRTCSRCVRRPFCLSSCLEADSFLRPLQLIAVRPTRDILERTFARDCVYEDPNLRCVRPPPLLGLDSRRPSRLVVAADASAGRKSPPRCADPSRIGMLRLQADPSRLLPLVVPPCECRHRSRVC